jgi:hypothetical protein
VHSSYICTNYPLRKLSIDSKYSVSKGREYLGNDNRIHRKHDITWRERERDRGRIQALHSIRVSQIELHLQRKQSYTLSREHHAAEPISYSSFDMLSPSIYLPLFPKSIKFYFLLQTLISYFSCNRNQMFIQNQLKSNCMIT